MDELDKLLAPPGDELDALLAPNSASVPPPATGGFRAAAKQAIGSTIKGAGQLAADVAPSLVSQDNALKQYGQEVTEANPTKVQGFRDIVENPGTTVTEATGNAAGSIGAMLGMRALGQGITALSPFTGAAAPVVAGAGQLTSWGGPALAAALPSFGGIRGKQIEKDPTAAGDFKDKAIAALGAATVGIIESKFGPQDWALKLTSEAGRKQLAGMLADTTVMKAIGSGAVKGGAIEGAEEIVQNPVEQLASGDNPLTKESLTETAFGGVMGAVGGGVLGGAMGPAMRPRAQEVLDDTPSVDPVTDRVSGELLTTLLPEGITLNGTKNSMANVSFPTADGQTATINIPIDEVSKLLAANKPDEIAAALEWVEQERAAKIFKQKQNLPEEGDLTQADVEAQRLQAEAYNKARIGIVPKNPVVAKPAKPQPYTRLPDDPAKPDTVQYNVRGEVRTFAPAEGMSKAEVEEALAARKGPGSQVAWLQKNTVEVTNVNPTKSGEVPAPAADAGGYGEAAGSAPQRTAEAGVPPVSQPAPEPTVPVNEVETKPVAAGAVKPAGREAVPPPVAEGLGDLPGEAQKPVTPEVPADGVKTSPEARQKDEDLRQMLTDHIATIKRNGQPVKQAHLDKLAEVEARLSGATVDEDLITSDKVFGHPEATAHRPEIFGNLVPIKISKDASIDKFVGKAQTEIDKLQKQIGTAEAIVKKQIKSTPAEMKKAKAYLSSQNHTEDTSTLELLKTETMPELERIAKQLTPPKASPRTSTPSASAKAPASPPQGVTSQDLSKMSAADIATEMSKMVAPRPLNKMFGQNPTPEQQAEHKALVRAHASARSKLSKQHKIALERDNAAFQAEQEAKKAAAAKPPTLPGVKYDGKNQFTITEGKAKGASFTVKDLSPESVQAAHDKTVKGFVKPKVTLKEQYIFDRGMNDGAQDAALSTTVDPEKASFRAGYQKEWERQAYRKGYLLGQDEKYRTDWKEGNPLTKSAINRGDIEAVGFEAVYNGRDTSYEETKTAPKASVVARVAARKHKVLAPTVAEVIKEDGTDMYKRVPSVEAYTALAETRRELDPKAKIDDRLFYELASMSEKDYQEVMPLDSVESEMVAKAKPEKQAVTSEKKTLGGDPDAQEAQAMQAGLEGKTALEATKFLVDNAPTASNRIIAEKVRNVLQRLTAQGIKFNFKIAHVGDQVPASLANARGMSSTWFNKTPMTVDVWLNGADVTGKSGMSYEVALHEFIHAATQAALHLGNRRAAAGTATAKAVADLYAVTNEIIAHFNARIEANKNDMGNLTRLERAIFNKRTNALANPHEILAWTLSNKEMQEYLETIKSGPETLWSKFVSSIRTLLGLPVSSNTALAKVLAASEQIFDAPVNELLTAAKTGTPATVAQTTAMNVEDTQAATAGWSPERIDAEIGYAAYDDGRTKAVVGFVNPKDFIAATTDAPHKARKIAREAGDLDLEKLRRESQSMFLYVSEDGKIIDHEGRHRMAALANAGIERVPVVLDYRNGKKRPEADSVNLMGQVFPFDVGKNLDVFDVTPLTFENRTKIQEMMSGDSVISFQQSVESQMISSLNTAVKDARATAANALASLNNPKDALHDKWLQHAPKVLAVTPLSHLAQTYGKTIHWIKDLAKHTNELEATTTRLIDDFFAIHETATKAAEQETGIDKFNRAMLVATFNQMNPTRELSKQDWVSDKLPPGQQIVAAQKSWVDAGMQKATGMTFTQAYAESKKEYEALGPKTQKQMVEIAKYLGNLRDMDRDASLAFIEKVSKDGSDLRKSLMEQFNNSFSRLKGMYFPLSRYGKFVLQFTGTDGRPVIEQFDTVRERKDAMLTAIANGVDEQTIVLRMQDENPAGAVAIPSELLTKLREAITTQYMTDVDKKDKEAVAAVNNQIEAALAGFNQTVLRWLPDTSALKNSMTRKSVLGANPDMLRSVNGYVQRHAGRIAWSTVGRQIEDDIAGFAGENKEMAKAGDVDLTMRGHLLNNSRMWLQAVQKERVSALTSHIGKLMTGYFMTSPSTFLVQMTQLPTLTLPHLAAKYKSYGKATSALTTAMGQAFSKKFAKEAMRGDARVNEVYDAIHRKVSHKDRTAGKAVGTDWFTQSEKLAMVGRLTPYQKQLLALREAESRNLLDISAVHEAIDVSQGNQQGMLGKAMRLAMLPMQHGELASRKAAILASFDLASTGKKDFFEAMDETADVIDKTIYNFSKRDKGWLMQKDLMRIPFTFQTYRIKTALRLGLLFRDSLRAFKEGGMEKGLADAATKEFIGIFMTSGALAGSLGVPFAGTAMGIISLLFGSDDDEPKDMKLEYTNFLTDTFGQTVGDVLAYGLPTLVGTNLSRRIGMGDIYGASSQPPEQLHGAGLAAWWAGNLIGPSYSIAESWVKGYDEIMNKGNYMKGLETASPKPIKDVFKAIRTATDGVKDGAGKKLLDDSQIGPDEILMIALGFAPDEITRAQNAERSLREISGRISTRRGRLIRQAAEGVIDGDASDALAEIREFNAKMPRFAIGGRDIKPAVRKILRGELGTTGKRERGVATQFEVPVYME